jgi:putative ABC transport system substrate-binding protein
MTALRAAVWLTPAALFSFLARPAAAFPAIVVAGDIPAFREAVDGARAVLPQARVYGGAGAAAQLAIDHPEVIIAVGADALKIASALRPMPPVVFLLVANPQAVVGPLEGRPLTGIALTMSPNVVLQVLRKLVPKARQLWTVYSRQETGRQIEQLRAATAKEGFNLTTSEAGDAATALRHLLSPPQTVDAYVMLPDRVVRNTAADEALIKMAFERHFVVVGSSAADVRRGALFALQLDAHALGRQAGELARGIASAQAGAHPAMVNPVGYRLILNASSADYLGISVPADVQENAAVIGK